MSNPATNIQGGIISYSSASLYKVYNIILRQHIL